MFRALAWALLDYRLSGGSIIVNSADRRDSVLKKFAPDKHGQDYLYRNQHKPGFFPANPPNRTSHCLFSDGNPAYRYKGRHYSPGERIPDLMLGIDAVDKPGGSAEKVVRWLNDHGYKAVRPYNTGSERHHFIFLESPAKNAIKRLTKHYAKKTATNVFKTAWLDKDERRLTLELRRLRRDGKDVPRRSEIKVWLGNRVKLLKGMDTKKLRRAERIKYLQKVIDNDPSIRLK